MKTILVTGGCGFIGSNFIHHLIKTHTYNIVNLDKLTYAANKSFLSKILKDKKRVKFINCDLVND